MPLVSIPGSRAEREAARSTVDEAAAREWHRCLVRLFVAWLGWFSLGTAIVLASFGVAGREIGDVLFWLGLSVGWIGALLSLMFFAVAGTARGDL